MGKKPVLGLAALSLVSFAVNGCWNTDHQLCNGGRCTFGKPTWAAKNPEAKQQEQPSMLPGGWNDQAKQQQFGGPLGLPPLGGQPQQGVRPAGFTPNMGGAVNDSSLKPMGGMPAGGVPGAPVGGVPAQFVDPAMSTPPALPPVQPTATRGQRPVMTEDNTRLTDMPPMPPPATNQVYSVPPAQPVDINAPPPMPGGPRGNMTISTPASLPPLPPPPNAPLRIDGTRTTTPTSVEIQPVGGIQE